MLSTTDVRGSAAWPSAVRPDQPTLLVQAPPVVSPAPTTSPAPVVGPAPVVVPAPVVPAQVQLSPGRTTSDGSSLAALDPARPGRSVSPATTRSGGQPAGVDVAVALTAGADVAVTVAPGEAVGVVGAPGSGKTLITQVAAGLAGRGTHPEWESTAALVVDDAIVHEALTVEATLRYWASVAEPSLFGTALTERVAEVIDATGLGRWRHTPVEHCHQVVRRAITVAVALFDRPTVLVLDEPLRKMAPRHRQTILLLLDALRAHGIGLLYATRCEDQASALCDRVITLPDPVETTASRAS